MCFFGIEWLQDLVGQKPRSTEVLFFLADPRAPQKFFEGKFFCEEAFVKMLSGFQKKMVGRSGFVCISL